MIWSEHIQERYLEAYFIAMIEGNHPGLPIADSTRIARWFLDRRDFFADLSSNPPTVHEGRVWDRLKEARGYVAVEGISSLDEWLRRDLADEIGFGLTRSEIPEPCASKLLAQVHGGNGAPALMRYHETLNRIRGFWPRPCKSCGTYFRPERRSDRARTCRACLDAQYSHRAPKGTRHEPEGES